MSKKIREILETAEGHPLDIYYTLYTEYLLTSKVPAKVLKEILQFEGLVSTHNDEGNPHYISPELVGDVYNNYSPLLRSIVRSLTMNNPTADDFYEKLYENVFQSDMFPCDKESQTVLLYMLGNSVYEIPYYPATNLYTVDNEEFSSRLDAARSQIREAIHMLNRPFKQKTEEASQLYRISQTIQDENNRIVYWAFIINYLRKTHEQRIEKEEKSGAK